MNETNLIIKHADPATETEITESQIMDELNGIFETIQSQISPSRGIRRRVLLNRFNSDIEEYIQPPNLFWSHRLWNTKLPVIQRKWKLGGVVCMRGKKFIDPLKLNQKCQLRLIRPSTHPFVLPKDHYCPPPMPDYASLAPWYCSPEVTIPKTPTALEQEVAALGAYRGPECRVFPSEGYDRCHRPHLQVLPRQLTPDFCSSEDYVSFSKSKDNYVIGKVSAISAADAALENVSLLLPHNKWNWQMLPGKTNPGCVEGEQTRLKSHSVEVINHSQGDALNDSACGESDTPNPKEANVPCVNATEGGDTITTQPSNDKFTKKKSGKPFLESPHFIKNKPVVHRMFIRTPKKFSCWDLHYGILRRLKRGTSIDKYCPPSADEMKRVALKYSLRIPPKLMFGMSNLGTSCDSTSSHSETDRNAQDTNRCGIINTRAEYYNTPPVEVLDTMMDESGKCLVKSFVIGRIDHGEIRFLDAVDVAGVNIDKMIHFRHKEVEVYPDDTIKPPPGSGLNVRALIILERVWPIDKMSKDLVKSPTKLRSMGYETVLHRACMRLGAKFISYIPQTGTWTFEVPNFSNSEEDHGNDKVETSVPDNIENDTQDDIGSTKASVDSLEEMYNNLKEDNPAGFHVLRTLSSRQVESSGPRYNDEESRTPRTETISSSSKQMVPCQKGKRKCGYFHNFHGPQCHQVSSSADEGYLGSEEDDDQQENTTDYWPTPVTTRRCRTSNESKRKEEEDTIERVDRQFGARNRSLTGKGMENEVMSTTSRITKSSRGVSKYFSKMFSKYFAQHN